MFKIPFYDPLLGLSLSNLPTETPLQLKTPTSEDQTKKIFLLARVPIGNSALY